MKPQWAHLVEAMMGTRLACVYLAGQRLSLTIFAQSGAPAICETWWIEAEEVKDIFYEVAPRSRPAQNFIIKSFQRELQCAGSVSRWKVSTGIANAQAQLALLALILRSNA